MRVKIQEVPDGAGDEAVKDRIAVRIDTNTVIFIRPDDDRDQKIREYLEVLKRCRTLC